MSDEQLIAAAMLYISSHEGPRTNYVLILRACTYLSRQSVSLSRHPNLPHVVANALFQCLLAGDRIQDDSVPPNDRA